MCGICTEATHASVLGFGGPPLTAVLPIEAVRPTLTEELGAEAAGLCELLSIFRNRGKWVGFTVGGLSVCVC